MKFYYFNSTHWDREWYQPFQEFRKYLVDATGELLNIFEHNPEFEKFTFDGQTIVLEDICEIRPDWRPKLKQLIRNKQLRVGPWYVMPDEFLVSGEALVRNLLVGHRVAREFGGEALPVGYICDIFGHLAQIPQLFAGFGLLGAVIWRGSRGKDYRHFVLWESPDGTRLKTLNLPKSSGYGNFTIAVRGIFPTELNEQEFKEKFKAFVTEDYDDWGETFVLTDAFDHATPFGETAKMFRCIRECFPEAEIIHTDYTELFDREYDSSDLSVISGEQIFPVDSPKNGAWQISGTLSSRPDVKRANDLCQNELELLIEPEAAIRLARGEKEFLPLLDYNWKHLLQNHAHDSICGCSIDQVHRMVLCRFEEVRNVSRTLHEEFRFADLEKLTGKKLVTFLRQNFVTDKEKEAAAADGRYTVRVFNPLPYPVKETTEMELAIPAHDRNAYPKRQAEPFGFEFLNSFRLYDKTGVEIPYQIRKVRRNQTKAFYRQDNRSYDLYTILCPLSLPASSWSSLELRPAEDFVRRFDTLATGPSNAENAFLRLDINPDGTFHVTDKRSGRCYERLNDFSVNREIGDGWNHATPTGCRRTTGSCDATVSLTLEGPERVEFEIVRRYRVARELLFEGTIHEKYAGIRESDESVTLEIVTTVALDKESDAISCRTVVRNNVKDYRLQMLLPTGIDGGYFASQAFTLLNRPAGRTLGNESEGFPESETIEKNFDGILGKRDNLGGVAFLTRAGIHEGGALTDPGHSLIITLLRAFRRTVQTNGETEGQVQGDQAFEYRIAFLESSESEASLFRRLQAFRAPLPSYLVKTEECLETEDTPFLTLDGEVAFSALKPAEDGKGVILRFFNPGTADAGVKIGQNAKRITRCRFDETVIGEERSDLVLRPSEVVTLRLEYI